MMMPLLMMFLSMMLMNRHFLIIFDYFYFCFLCFICFSFCGILLDILLFFLINFLITFLELLLQLLHLLLNILLFFIKFLLDFGLILFNLSSNCFILTGFLWSSDKLMLMAPLNINFTLNQRTLILCLEVRGVRRILKDITREIS